MTESSSDRPAASLSEADLLGELNDTAGRLFSQSLSECTERQAYRVLCTWLKERLARMRRAFSASPETKNRKKVYYLSMEFLVGTSLYNNLFNLGLADTVRAVLENAGFSLASLCDLDPDAGLGNGGLGRLASCYMDAMTGLGHAMIGFSIRYEFGIFRQKIIDGWQVEFPDNWLDRGEVWLSPRPDESYEVRFGGTVNEWFDGDRFTVSQSGYQSVTAVPYDLYISGYHSEAVNKLVLWSAQAPGLDLSAFSRGEYVRSLEQNTMAEVISKVLYPADNHIEGKRLRLRQQYLLVSASLQSILAAHLREHHAPGDLPDHAAIHINDTHPALSVPELMRLLMDEHGMGWDEAWDITCRTLSYTNHTVMSEALERWSVGLFREQLPRIWSIVSEIDRRLTASLSDRFPNDPDRVSRMAVIGNGEVRMANLCLCTCHTVNGVSRLHTEILKKDVFRDYCELDESRFQNVTNGIAYRRWLCQANPALTAFLRERIGDGFLSDAAALEELLSYRDDPATLEALRQIKRQNKQTLAAYIEKKNGIHVDPDSLFDVQVKRLHEYKRQLLNVLNILALYRSQKDDPGRDVTPRTFLFAAKASPGYDLAKQIIRLIGSVSDLVNRDPQMKNRLRVVFLEDYRVSLAETIIPAADLSEQISAAGREASGTGNMKLMINGAVTLGTLDGANVEILEQVGRDNLFLFGLTAEEAALCLKNGYRPQEIVDRDPRLRDVLTMLTDGSLGCRFDDIAASLLTDRFGMADRFLTLADFDDYVRVSARAGEVYRDRDAFTRMSLVNIARAGVFSADRAVTEYADRIWKL